MSKHGQSENLVGIFSFYKLTRVPKTVRNNIKRPRIRTSKKVIIVVRRTASDFFGLKALSKVRNGIVTEISLIDLPEKWPAILI